MAHYDGFKDSYYDPISRKEIQLGIPPEKDPLGKTQHEPGAKLDEGKAPIWQGVIAYFPRAITEVARLSAYGANKYAWKGWEAVPNGVNRYADALGRHATKEAIEGQYDLEIRNDPKYPAEVLHATQVAWNALARLELILRAMERGAVREQMDPVEFNSGKRRETMTYTTKSDATAVQEAKDILDAFMEKATELYATRGIVLVFSLTNGNDGNQPVLTQFGAIKKIDLVGKQDNAPVPTLMS